MWSHHKNSIDRFIPKMLIIIILLFYLKFGTNTNGKNQEKVQETAINNKYSNSKKQLLFLFLFSSNFFLFLIMGLMCLAK